MGKLDFALAALLLVIAVEAWSKCEWTTCRTHYKGYRPEPPQGKCVFQRNIAEHIYFKHSQSKNCPSSQSCSGRDGTKVRCSCKELNLCRWVNWGSWIGYVERGKWGTQTRYRRGIASHRYTTRDWNCNGVKTKCSPEYDQQSRKMYNCRHASSCDVLNWSSWSPDEQVGNCVTQKREKQIRPTYSYHMKENDCFGYNPKCPDTIRSSRTMCSCPIVECVRGEWTKWELQTWTGKCPTEHRKREYRTIPTYKRVVKDCIDIGPKSCPKPQGQVRDIDVICPKLPVPLNGKHQDKACDGANSKCEDYCNIKCNTGYLIQGNASLRCNPDGKWSSDQGTCKDSVLPEITCPDVDRFDNKAGEIFRMINLPSATATDNSGIMPTITVSHQSPLKVMIGKPQNVKYTATDAAGNKKSCSKMFDVKDKDPPQVIKCPPQKTVVTGQKFAQVFWETPKFFDLYDKDNLEVIRSHENGGKFPRGLQTNVTYSARDQSYNYAKCEFTVSVQKMSCPVYDPPKNGLLTCNIRNEGVKEKYICSASCKSGSWFVKGEGLTEHYDYYICTGGEWLGQNTFNLTNPNNLVKLPKDQSPWPDCAGEHWKTLKLNAFVFQTR